MRQAARITAFALANAVLVWAALAAIDELRAAGADQSMKWAVAGLLFAGTVALATSAARSLGMAALLGMSLMTAALLSLGSLNSAIEQGPRFLKGEGAFSEGHMVLAVSAFLMATVGYFLLALLAAVILAALGRRIGSPSLEWHLGREFQGG